jgi:hypothetical protein
VRALIAAARPIACLAAVAPLAVMIACGDESEVPEDERIRQISGVAELATNAYAAAGPEGLIDYLAKDVAERCSKEAIKKALAENPVPEGFKGVSNVSFDGSRARADVLQLFVEEERAVEWSFVLEDEASWRITDLPGLEACES